MSDPLVCSRCGLEVARSRQLNKFVHVEEPPDKGWEPHEIENGVTRRAYLFGQQKETVKSYAERQTEAWERIATALEEIVQRMDS